MHYVCVRKGSKYWQTRMMSFYHLLVGFVFKVDYLALAAMSVWSCSPEIGMPNFIAKDIFDAAHAEARRDHAAD